jgi:hypothetical protein
VLLNDLKLEAEAAAFKARAVQFYPKAEVFREVAAAASADADSSTAAPETSA